MILEFLTYLYEDEENQKQSIRDKHRFLSSVYEIIGTEEQMLMHGRIAIKLEKEVYGEIRRSGRGGYLNFYLLNSLGLALSHRSVRSKTLKQEFQEFYDEAMEYFHEALSIAETIQPRPNLLLYTTVIYLHLSYWELEKEGEGNLQKALEYKKKGSLMFSELDQTFISENPDRIKNVLDLFEENSNLIKQKFLV